MTATVSDQSLSHFCVCGRLMACQVHVCTCPEEICEHHVPAAIITPPGSHVRQQGGLETAVSRRRVSMQCSVANTYRGGMLDGPRTVCKCPAVIFEHLVMYPCASSKIVVIQITVCRCPVAIPARPVMKMCQQGGWMDSQTTVCTSHVAISAQPVSQMCQCSGLVEAQRTVYERLAVISVLCVSQVVAICQPERASNTQTELCGHPSVISNRLVSHMCEDGGMLVIHSDVCLCPAVTSTHPVPKRYWRNGEVDAQFLLWTRPVAISTQRVSQMCPRVRVVELQPAVHRQHVALSSLRVPQMLQVVEMCGRNITEEEPHLPILPCASIVRLSLRSLCRICVEPEECWGSRLMCIGALRLEYRSQCFGDVSEGGSWIPKLSCMLFLSAVQRCHPEGETKTQTPVCGHPAVIAEQLESQMYGRGGMLVNHPTVYLCPAATTAQPVLQRSRRKGVVSVQLIGWTRPEAISAQLVSQMGHRGRVVETRPPTIGCLQRVALTVLHVSQMFQVAERCCRNTFKEELQIPSLLCVGIMRLSQRTLCRVRVKVNEAERSISRLLCLCVLWHSAVQLVSDICRRGGVAVEGSENLATACGRPVARSAQSELQMSPHGGAMNTKTTVCGCPAGNTAQLMSRTRENGSPTTLTTLPMSQSWQEGCGLEAYTSAGGWYPSNPVQTVWPTDEGCFMEEAQTAACGSPAVLLSMMVVKCDVQGRVLNAKPRIAEWGRQSASPNQPEFNTCGQPFATGNGVYGMTETRTAVIGQNFFALARMPCQDILEMLEAWITTLGPVRVILKHVPQELGRPRALATRLEVSERPIAMLEQHVSPSLELEYWAAQCRIAVALTALTVLLTARMTDSGEVKWTRTTSRSQLRRVSGLGFQVPKTFSVSSEIMLDSEGHTPDSDTAHEPELVSCYWGIRLVISVSTCGPPAVRVTAAALLLVAVVILGSQTNARPRQFMEADRVDGPRNGEPAPAFLYFETLALLLLFFGLFAEIFLLNYNLFFSHFTCGGPDAPSSVSSAWRRRQRRKKCCKRSIHNAVDLFLLVTVTILAVFGEHKSALDKNLYRISLVPVTVVYDSDADFTGSTVQLSSYHWRGSLELGASEIRTPNLPRLRLVPQNCCLFVNRDRRSSSWGWLVGPHSSVPQGWPPGDQRVTRPRRSQSYRTSSHRRLPCLSPRYCAKLNVVIPNRYWQKRRARTLVFKRYYWWRTLELGTKCVGFSVPSTEWWSDDGFHADFQHFAQQHESWNDRIRNLFTMKTYDPILLDRLHQYPPVPFFVLGSPAREGARHE